MAFQMPPKAETCRLVATSTIDMEIHLTVLHYEDGFVYFKLSDIEKQRKDIQEYITDLKTDILSGVYQVELVEMEQEEMFC